MRAEVIMEKLSDSDAHDIWNSGAEDQPAKLRKKHESMLKR